MRPYNLIPALASHLCPVQPHLTFSPGLQQSHHSETCIIYSEDKRLNSYH